jgi:hypothetical protein
MVGAAESAPTSRRLGVFRGQFDRFRLVIADGRRAELAALMVGADESAPREQ